MRPLRFPARLLCTLLLAGLLGASTTLAQTPARTLSDTVPLNARGAVTVDNHEGRIVIDTWDRDEVRYEIRIMPTEDDPDAEETAVEIDRSSDRLQLATTHADGGGSGLFNWLWSGSDIADVHYLLTVPRTAALTIDDHESDIEVTGLQGTLRIDTHEGPITVADQGGNLLIDSHESEMDLRNVEGNLEIDTHEGEITIANLRGGFRLDAHDADAEVTFAALTDEVDIDTHDGRITLRLAADAAFDLRTDLDDDADLNTEFTLDAIRVTDDDEVNYRGAVNGGGPRVYLASSNGDFALRIR